MRAAAAATPVRHAALVRGRGLESGQALRSKRIALNHGQATAAAGCGSRLCEAAPHRCLLAVVAAARSCCNCARFCTSDKRWSAEEMSLTQPRVVRQVCSCTAPKAARRAAGSRLRLTLADLCLKGPRSYVRRLIQTQMQLRCAAEGCWHTYPAIAGYSWLSGYIRI